MEALLGAEQRRVESLVEAAARESAVVLPPMFRLATVPLSAQALPHPSAAVVSATAEAMAALPTGTLRHIEPPFGLSDRAALHYESEARSHSVNNLRHSSMLHEDSIHDEETNPPRVHARPGDGSAAAAALVDEVAPIPAPQSSPPIPAPTAPTASDDRMNTDFWPEIYEATQRLVSLPPPTPASVELARLLDGETRVQLVAAVLYLTIQRLMTSLIPERYAAHDTLELAATTKWAVAPPAETTGAAAHPYHVVERVADQVPQPHTYLMARQGERSVGGTFLYIKDFHSATGSGSRTMRTEVTGAPQWLAVPLRDAKRVDDLIVAIKQRQVTAAQQLTFAQDMETALQLMANPTLPYREAVRRYMTAQKAVLTADNYVTQIRQMLHLIGAADDLSGFSALMQTATTILLHAKGIHDAYMRYATVV